MPATTSISRAPNGDHELRLQGQFERAHWVAFLFSGLSRLEIAVISGKATRDRDRNWNARFTLDFRGSQAVPERVDYLQLAQQETTSAFAPPLLSEFAITRRSDQALEVILQGPDQIGFLGRILLKLSLLTLFPIEMEINTVSGRIHDRIVFCGIGGLPPGTSVDASLEAMLRGLVRTA